MEIDQQFGEKKENERGRRLKKINQNHQKNHQKSKLITNPKKAKT